MKLAWQRNHKAANALQGAHQDSKGMLLFYSAECGLKFLVMTDQGQRTTAQISSIGHNVQRLIAEAKISRSELSQPGSGAVSVPNIRLSGSNDRASFSDFHTAMRYCIELETADRDAAIEFLDQIKLALLKRIAA